MPSEYTTSKFFSQTEQMLKLEWIAGKNSGDRIIQGQTDAFHTLVGYLSMVRPNQIQVLGLNEIEYLKSLGKNSYEDAQQRLFNCNPVIIIFARDTEVESSFIEQCNAHNVALFSSELHSGELIELIHYHLTRLLSDYETVHGVFLEVMGIGVLITGSSGIGKSELALELVSRGHRLVADDAPEFRRTAPNTIRGRCPSLLQDFLEVRGIGILNIRAMYGDNAVTESKRLRLVVHLEHMSDPGIRQLDRLETQQRTRRILNIDIPEVLIPVAPGRDLAVIVEAAVRNHVLLINGYSATHDFIVRQQQLLNKEEE